MRVIIIILTIFISLNVQGQKILKGKLLSGKLSKIESLLSDKEFEKGIALFESKSEIISEQKVKKKDFEKYNNIKTIIQQKKNEFAESKLKVNKWNDLYGNQEYEILLNNFDFNLSDESCTSQTFKTYSKIKSFMIDWGKEYETFSNNYIYYQQKAIINKPIDGTYQQTLERIKQAENELKKYSSMKKPNGKVPILDDLLAKTKKDIENKIKLLNEYAQENKPLTSEQIEALFKSKEISIKQIEKYANFVDKQYSNIFVTIPINGNPKKIELYELADLISLDVVRYYKLWDKYNSELKVKAFSKTEEYKNKYNSMKKIYDEIIDMYFYMPINFSCYSNKYDLKTKTFSFKTSELEGFQYGKNTNYIQFKELCIKKPLNAQIEERVRFGGSDYFFEQEYSIPVQDENIALQLEEKCKTSSIMFVFKIKDVERKKTSFLKTSFIKTEPHNILLFDKNTQKVYINYIYK